MSLEVVLPSQNELNASVKDLIFSILIEEEEKTLSQLQRELKKRYAVSVSFQAVLKASHSLLSHGVLVKNKKVYAINKEWILNARKFFDRLYLDFFKVRKPIQMEVGKEIIVYTLRNLFELDKLWNDLLFNWVRNADDKRNVWIGRHCWWLIPRMQEEDFLHDFFRRNKIKTYNLITSNSLLDHLSLKYYSKKKEFCLIDEKIQLEKDQHVSAFGDFLIKFEIPKAISNRIESIYRKTKNLTDLDLKNVLDIYKKDAEITLTLIKDKFLADNIKEKIISSFS